MPRRPCRRRVGRRLGQPRGNGAVEASPLARQQVRVDDLGEEGVAKPVGPGLLVDLEHVAGDGLADRLDELVVWQPVTVARSASSAREPATATAPRTRWAARRQPRDAADEDVAERSRDGRGPRRDPARTAGRTISSAKNGLPSARAWISLDDTAPRPVARGSRRAARAARRGQRPEVDPLDGREPVDLGQPGEERIAALEVVRPERRRSIIDPTLPQVPGEEREQVAGRGIAPVEVLQDEDERPVAAQAVDEGEGELEQPVGSAGA